MPRGRTGSRPAPPGYPQQARQQILQKFGANRRGYPTTRPSGPISFTPPEGPAYAGTAPPIRRDTPGVPGGPAAPGGPAGGLPLNPAFEAGRRSLEDILAGSLSQLGAQRQQVPLEAEMMRQRLQTNQNEDNRLTREGANARGLFGGSVMARGLQQVGQGYGRQREDLSMDVARRLAALAGQESQARLGYQGGLAELLMQSAAQSAADPSAPGFSDIPWSPDYYDIGMPSGAGGGGRGGRGGRGGGGGRGGRGGKRGGR